MLLTLEHAHAILVISEVWAVTHVDALLYSEAVAIGFKVNHLESLKLVLEFTFETVSLFGSYDGQLFFKLT